MAKSDEKGKVKNVALFADDWNDFRQWQLKHGYSTIHEAFHTMVNLKQVIDPSLTMGEAPTSPVVVKNLKVIDQDWYQLRILQMRYRKRHVRMAFHYAVSNALKQG